MKRIEKRTFSIPILCGWATLAFCSSCSQSNTPVSTPLLTPVVVEANGYVVPQDSIELPIQFPLHSPRVIKEGRPKLVPISTEPLFFPTPPTRKAGRPTVCTAGQNGYALPRQVSAVHQPFIAGNPEKVTAKAPGIRDQNAKNISTFGLAQGLKNLNITETIQDKFGNLWIATAYGGVSKYDGESFTNYTEKEGLPNNTVLDILLDHEGNLWFATFLGASKFDGTNFTNYTEQEGLVNNLVFEIIEDKNHAIWFATYGGVSRLDPRQKTFTHFTKKQGLPYDLVHRIREDKQGDMWLCTYDHGVSNLSIVQVKGRVQYTFKNYTEKEGLIANNVIAIAEDDSGSLWFGTAAGVSKFIKGAGDGEAHFQQFTSKNGLSDNIVYSIMPDRRGRILFATNNGITIYGSLTPHKTGCFTYLTEKDGLPDYSVSSLFEDKLGHLWIGTESGLCQYNTSSFSFFTNQDGLSGNTIQAILEDKKGNIWLGTQGQGITKYQRSRTGSGGVFKQYTQKEGLSSDMIFCIYEDRKENIWFGTLNGVTKYKPGAHESSGTFTHYTMQQGLPANHVAAILEDEAGTMWFGIHDAIKGGVTKFDEKTFTHFSLEQGLAKREILSIAEDKKGHFWFGTWGDGVIKYEPALDGQKGRFTHFTKKSGLSNNKVRPIKVDASGNVWLGTLGGGVNKYEEAIPGKPATFTHYTEREGLSNNDVRSILEDRQGNLWFGNYYGISRHLTTEKDKLFENYTQDDGFKGTGCMTNSICEDKQGKLWIGAFKKLTIFDPKKQSATRTIPNVQLTDIHLFNEQINWKKDTSFFVRSGVKVGGFRFKELSPWYHIPNQLSLPYTNNFITFDFVGINVNAPQTVRYQYQLAGLEKSWSAITNRSEASYGNLSPGTYTFKVRAMNGGSDSGKGFDYTLTIRPPWWKTWWAYLLYAMIIGGLAYSLVRYRVAQALEKIRALETIRTKISSDLHDDVGSILSGLSMQSQILALTASEEQKQSLIEISTMSHEAMEHMRDTVWAIDSRKDKYENLLDRMRAFAERNLSMKQITYQFDITIDNVQKFIDPQKRQNIYLIFKEALVNSCKHSDASHIRIQFTESKNHLCLLIHDNGSPKKVINSHGSGILKGVSIYFSVF